MLLLGSDSPSFLHAATETLDSSLPNSRIVVMQGQQHIAMYTAPHLFVRNVLSFLAKADPVRKTIRHKYNYEQT